jgi:hypothetical protein
LCRFCPGVPCNLLLEGGDVWTCSQVECSNPRCSYCGLDIFSGHWTKDKQTCTFRLGRHGNGFNFLSLCVSYFSP